MHFFSGSGGGRSGALLPTTSKPKAHHHLRSKSSLSAPASSRRRGGGLHSASSPYSRRALCLAATAFAALFILAFLRLGFPSSRSAALSSPARPRGARLTRRPAFRHRDSAAAEAAAAAVAARIGREAPVDITTRDLYDRIDFSDVDGGAWKQGWEVKYRGDEWDAEKLKVFVAPHSHNDPGWIRTVEEYYERQSRHILDTIVESLSKVLLVFSPLEICFWVSVLFSFLTIVRILLWYRIRGGSSYGRRCRTLRGGGATRRPRSKRHSLSLSVTGSSKS